MKTFGERIMELREKYDLDRKDFAKMIEVSNSSITRFENGEIQPTLKVMLKIKQKFDVSLDWLAGYETDEELEYKKLINELEKSDIKAETLKKIVDIIKEQ